MSLFLSKKEQLSTDPILTLGLWFMTEEEDANIITALYSKNCIEYYLFNKLKIWRSKP